MRLSVRHQRYIGFGRRDFPDVSQEGCNDVFTQPLPLMRWIDGNVDKVEEQRAVADDPPHRDCFLLILDTYREKAARQTSARSFYAPGCKAAYAPQA